MRKYDWNYGTTDNYFVSFTCEIHVCAKFFLPLAVVDTFFSALMVIGLVVMLVLY